MVVFRPMLAASLLIALLHVAALASPPVDWATNVKYLAERTHDEWANSNASAAYFWAGRWIEADAKAIEPHMIRASALMALKAPAAAIESCDAGLALNPPAGLRLFQLYMLRAGALDEVGEGEAAFNDIRRARQVAATLGDEAAQIRAAADKLYWSLIVRMHSAAASDAQAKRPAGPVVELDDQSSAAQVLGVTDDMIEDEAMTASLWYRRARAAMASDSMHEAFVAAAQARIADEDVPQFADVRKWMDETLAQAASAPARAARERAANRQESALAILQQAARINSADGEVHLSLASLYIELGAPDLARDHAELAWRCQMSDPVSLRRLSQLAAQSSHWRLIHATTSKLLDDAPLDMDLRHLRAAAANVIGDAKGVSHEFSIMQAGGMLPSERDLWLDVLGFGAFKPSQPNGPKLASRMWEEDLLKKEGTPAELRWWAMLREQIIGQDISARLVSGAPPGIKPRVELLAQYLTAKLSEEDYLIRSEAISAGGHAHFAIGMRRSFIGTDDAARHHLLAAASDASLPIFYRSAAQTRVKTVWGAAGTSPSQPLTAREPVLVGQDVATLEEAVKMARPSQWIHLLTPGPHDLPAAPVDSLRIRSVGPIAKVRPPQAELKQGAGLHEYDGVEIEPATYCRMISSGGVLTFRRSVLARNLQLMSKDGAVEILKSGTSGLSIVIGAGSFGVIRESSIWSHVTVEGELLIHRSAMPTPTVARGPKAIITGSQVKQSAYSPAQGTIATHTLKADGGARITYTDSLVFVPTPNAPIAANGSQIEVGRVIAQYEPHLIARESDEGKVLVHGAVMSPLVQGRTRHEAKTAAELRTVLSKAKAGDVVSLIRADYEGPFEIAAGINIHGNGARLIASIAQGKPVVSIKGTGITLLLGVQIALKPEMRTPTSIPNAKPGEDYFLITPIRPLAGQKYFTALDVPAGNTVLLLYSQLSCNEANRMFQRPFLRALRLAPGAEVVSQKSNIYGNVLLEKDSSMWLHEGQISMADITGGGTLFATAETDGIQRSITGADTTFIAQPAVKSDAMAYLDGAIDPRESLDLNSADRIMKLLFEDARRQLARDVAAATNDDQRFDAINAYDQKFSTAAELRGINSADRIRQTWAAVRPYLHNDMLTARVVISLKGDGETLKLLIAQLPAQTQQAIRTYARTALDQINEGKRRGHDAIVQRMSYRQTYPPGHRYYQAAMKAHADGKPFAQFQAEMVSAEKARQAAAARAAEATRKAQLEAAKRAELMRQQQPAPQQTSRSSYTPTWDGSFSRHAMDSWSKLNQQVQQNTNKFYLQQYKQGFRSTPW